MVKDGVLIIEAREEQIKNPDYDAENSDWRFNREYSQYTAASLTTQNLNSWQYGRFEMRAKIDVRSGSWPAFWTLGENIDEVSWPACGEIDIMEFYAGKILANAAWRDFSETRWWTSHKSISRFEDSAWADQFHVWRMEWDEESIKLYLDDELLNTIMLEYALNDGKAAQTPFQQPHFIIINQAIGGTNGGDPGNTDFPIRYEIDYVRVYQKNNCSEKSISSPVRSLLAE